MPTFKQAYFSWLSVQYKIERINRTTLPYRMRLAAITATDTRTGKVWPQGSVKKSPEVY